MNIKEETVYSNVETANSKQLAILKKHFPNCFDRDGNFIQERMLEIVNDNEVELSKESYSLNWLGKSYSRLLANLPPKTLIREDVEHNAQDEHKDSKNLLIKGDNLEVLKHLVNAYSEKVKMIYIDPPYNTGSDGFVYNDDRKFTKEQLAELAGIDIDEAERILSFVDQGSSSHSAWLTFMYPRLYIAKELLREDGVIFISIDDNEVSQLRLLCDEVFGEANFISNIVWQKKYSPQNDATYLSDMHDHILLYAKNKQVWRPIPLPRTDKQNTAYKNPDNDPRGAWKSTDSTCNKSRAERPNLYYPIVRPDGKEILPLESRVWRYSKEVHEQKQSDNRVWWGKNGTNDVPSYKSFLSEVKDGRVPTTIWSYQEAGHNQEAKRELNDLIKESPFSTPKPTKLIQLAASISVKPNDGDIVMDFFAGSGTTAQAVMSLNAKDNGNRKFILVQIPEFVPEKSEASKAGYTTIFDITKQRVLKASAFISHEHPDYKGDMGLKIFETVEDFRVEEDEKELTLSNLTMFDDVLLTDEQYQTLLTTWVLYDGSELTTPIYDIDLDGYRAHLCDRRLYMIAPDFSSKALKALLHKLDDTDDRDFDPNKIIYYANNFDSVKQMELNEALKNYANKKSIEIDVVVRN
ncbi:site-specific DNA-methyltransferase [Vibrio cholerae]|uniref:site-specific DNA-methyltransferase n=1 Tax=Vibrio cholerae TaxID=666 RepID=UPI0011D32CDF|nr:site-specific DNA-methyltransferase [Vibrio cholerae]TXX69968.1 site-specific DNA-methyltransferase [Vibrio cholerae]GIA61779.1 type III restriction endonuclease subunit M [Vibrio cholerae]